MLHFNKIAFYCAFIACLIALQGCSGVSEEKKEVDATGEEQETDVGRRAGDAGDSDSDLGESDSMCDNDGVSTAKISSGDKPQTQAEKELAARKAKEAADRQLELANKRKEQAKAIEKTDYSQDKKGAQKLVKDAAALHLFDQTSKDKATQAAIATQNKDMTASWNKQFPDNKIAGAVMTSVLFAAAVKQMDPSKLSGVSTWLTSESQKYSKAVDQRKGFFARMWGRVKGLMKIKYVVIVSLTFIGVHIVLKKFTNIDLIRTIARGIEGFVLNIPFVGGWYSSNMGYVKTVFSNFWVYAIDTPLGHFERMLGIYDSEHIESMDGCKQGLASKEQWADTSKAREGCKSNKDLCAEGEVCMYTEIFNPAQPDQHIVSGCECKKSGEDSQNLCNHVVNSVYSLNSPHVCLPACGARKLTWDDVKPDSAELGYTSAEVDLELKRAAMRSQSDVELTCGVWSPSNRAFDDKVKAQALASPKCVFNAEANELQWDMEALKKDFQKHCKVEPRLVYNDCEGKLSKVTFGLINKVTGCTPTTQLQGEALAANDFGANKDAFEPAFNHLEKAEDAQKAHFDSMLLIIQDLASAATAAKADKPDAKVECVVGTEAGMISKSDLNTNFAGKKEYCSEVLAAYIDKKKSS